MADEEKRVKYNVQPRSHIADLKAMIQAKEKISLDQQYLIYEGKKLKDNKTFQFYNIKQDSSIIIAQLAKLEDKRIKVEKNKYLIFIKEQYNIFSKVKYNSKYLIEKYDHIWMKHMDGFCDLLHLGFQVALGKYEYNLNEYDNIPKKEAQYKKILYKYMFFQY